MASNFPLQIQGNYTPERIHQMPVKASETFIAGALVKNTSGEAQECGADPTTILGIALASAAIGLATPQSLFGAGTQGSIKTIPVYHISPIDVFFISCATTPVFATHFAQSYGVVKSTNWLLDISDTSNTRCIVVDVSVTPQQEGFYVRFLSANITLSGIVS